MYVSSIKFDSESRATGLTLRFTGEEATTVRDALRPVYDSYDSFRGLVPSGVVRASVVLKRILDDFGRDARFNGKVKLSREDAEHVHTALSYLLREFPREGTPAQRRLVESVVTTLARASRVRV